jgi:TPR repeat protein
MTYFDQGEMYDDLGRKYEFGDGVAQSDAEAVRCYEQAAELGSIHAQHTLGFFTRRAAA